MKCARCMEEITVPYFFEGKPFGYTCIKIINPIAKRKKTKEHWVVAESHNLNLQDSKQMVTAFIVGKRKTSFFVFKDQHHGRHITMNSYTEIADDRIYINIMALKNYTLIKDEIEGRVLIN